MQLPEKMIQSATRMIHEGFPPRFFFFFYQEATKHIAFQFKVSRHFSYALPHVSIHSLEMNREV